jgi:hypothetical protein
MLLVGTQQAAQALLKSLPQIMRIPVNSEAATGWEDLLLPEEDQPVLPNIDAQLKGMKTFGDVLGWAGAYVEERNGGVTYNDLVRPLKKALESGPSTHFTALRVARYVFRSMRFPCQISGIDQPSSPSAPVPFLHVYVPSQRKSFILYPGSRTFTIIEPEHAGLYRLPTNAASAQGKCSLFDIRVGGEKPDGVPYTH